MYIHFTGILIFMYMQFHQMESLSVCLFLCMYVYMYVYIYVCVHVDGGTKKQGRERAQTLQRNGQFMSSN